MLAASSSPSLAAHIRSTSSSDPHPPPPPPRRHSRPSPAFPTTATTAAASISNYERVRVPHAPSAPSAVPSTAVPASFPATAVGVVATTTAQISSLSPGIEEIRSALKRHTVKPTTPSVLPPSGKDQPRGPMSAEVTALEGGTRHIMPATTTVDMAPPATRPITDPTTEVANSTTAAMAPSLSRTVSSGAPEAVVAPVAAPPGTGSSNKRNSQDEDRRVDTVASPVDSGTQPKRIRAEAPAVKILPKQYEDADPNDIVILIASMLMELIRFNDTIPLHQGRLTRFHSRSPPRISVLDYLRRLTTHATLSPPILLSMVYYIDRLCALYPAFTVSSLTIHRFLITSATVASKGLSDSFWTNKTYARVGGISLTELAMLELEFLFRVEWRIVPQPEVLVDYYQSLVERCDGYEIERGDGDASVARTPLG